MKRIRSTVPACSQALVVEGGDDGLPGAGRHHDEIAPPVVDRPLGFELVEDLPLVAERADVERRDLDRQVGGSAALRAESLAKPVAVPRRVVRLERRVGPVAVERLGEGLEEVRLLDAREANVPLQPVGQRRPGHVRRADVRRRHPRRPAEQPRLGVQPRRSRLVGDLDVGAQLHEAVEGPLVGGAHVGRRDDAQPTAALAQLEERLLEHAEALPLDEGAEQVDVVR